MVAAGFGLALASGAALAETPGYFRAALAAFSPEVPPGWAYTLTTTRNQRTLVERFDPAEPPERRWRLRQLDGRAPTPDEEANYARSRPTDSAGGSQANFRKADLDPGSFVVVREDDAGGEFLGGFRAESAGPDKMLGHLRVRLFVSRQPAYVERYVLELDEPYSPVLGVKMNTLQVEARFTAPTGDQPSLPATQLSRFTGRILFFSTAEELDLIYSDFLQVRQ
jgi:hypothetical protein